MKFESRRVKFEDEESSAHFTLQTSYFELPTASRVETLPSCQSQLTFKRKPKKTKLHSNTQWFSTRSCFQAGCLPPALAFFPPYSVGGRACGPAG